MDQGRNRPVFSLSAKGVYGLTALVELGAQRNQGSIQIRDIAGAHRIPQHYLEQILVSLKKGGYVESFRGAQGGYALTRDPDSILVSEVLEHLEGKLSVVGEQRRDGILEFFWDHVQQELDKSLSGSLGDLLREKTMRDSQVDYVI
ncbi:MAG: Rrf2 family transcriptional regulator [Spirochaetales bacterium]|nr:MAG: Rrf2 family transcriptional regulator [Spirochaetales bacterium]